MFFLKSLIAKVFAYIVVRNIETSYEKAATIQIKILKDIVRKAKKTEFGEKHNFHKINNYLDFKKQIPVRDYEDFRFYIDKIKNGKKNILWPGKPKYLAKTSGTTSGVKLIPITKDSMPSHIKSSRDALLFYINKTKKTDFLKGKTIFIQGSPKLENINGILVGRLSGIVAHHIPFYLKNNNLPSFKTNSISDWENKINKICQETFNMNMTVIGGIPSWVQMYFEKLILLSKKTQIDEIFKSFNLYIYGGVNFEPYRIIFKKLIGKKIDTIEFFPASEGFFAYQNNQNDKGLLLEYNSGIFYEFIKTDEFESENAKRFSLKEVELDVNYVLIISTNAGLWAYNTGDTVMFTSLIPPKIIVTGRYKHFISAFGEHVISSEVEQSISEIAKEKNINIKEFTVAPKVNPKKGLPHHEWWIEFESFTKNFNDLEILIDKKMQDKNIYYKDLIKGKVLDKLKIIKVKKGGFNKHMKSLGKFGGQNKVPRVSNNRSFVDGLKKYKAK